MQSALPKLISNRSEQKEVTMATTMEYRYEALAQQSDALRVIFEGLPWGVIVADQRGQTSILQSCCGMDIGNRHGRDVLPNTRTSLEGLVSSRSDLSRAARINCPWFEPFAEKKIVDELIFVRNSQHRPGVWIRVNAWPLKDASRNGFRRGRDVPRFHPGTRGAAKLRTCFPGLSSRPPTASSSPILKASSSM